jgi:hypothetical protein
MPEKTTVKTEKSDPAKLLRRYASVAVLGTALVTSIPGCTSTAPRLNGPEVSGQVSRTFEGTIVGMDPVRTNYNSRWNGSSVNVIGMLRNHNVGIIGGVSGLFSDIGGIFHNSPTDKMEVMVQLPGPEQNVNGKIVVIPGQVIGVLQTLNQAKSLAVGEYVDVIENPNNGLCNIFPINQ